MGEHSTQHLEHDAPLSADIAAFARTVSAYVRTPDNVDEIGEALLRRARDLPRMLGEVVLVELPVAPEGLVTPERPLVIFLGLGATGSSDGEDEGQDVSVLAHDLRSSWLLG